MTRTSSMPAWAERTTYGAGGLLLAVGLAMSGYFLSQLAAVFGIGYPWAVALPIALDAGAIICVVLWVTGPRELESFGHNGTRLLLGLSMLGNALERALTFGVTAIPDGTPMTLGLLHGRLVELAQQLTSGTALERAATWLLLLVSVGIGVVFPVLTYVMTHAIILTRKAADAPSRRRRPTVEQPPAQQELPSPQEQQEHVPDRQHLDEHQPDEQHQDDVPAPPARPLPYVHDSRDLDPGTPDWQDRYDRLPGNGKREKLEHWLAREWDEGRSPVLTTADRVVDGNRTSNEAKRRLVDRGILPPEQRVEAPHLTAVG